MLRFRAAKTLTVCRFACSVFAWAWARHGWQVQCRRRRTRSAEKPGSSSASSVGHSECSRGCAALVARSTGSSDSRWAAVKNAAAAAEGLSAAFLLRLSFPCWKKPRGGAAHPRGRSWHEARRFSGSTAHSRTANNSTCSQ
jgi:hypothetical protein